MTMIKLELKVLFLIHHTEDSCIFAKSSTFEGTTKQNKREKIRVCKTARVGKKLQR